MALLCTSFSSRLLRHPSLVAVLQITRTKSYDRFSEEAKSYADFRRGISEARKKFQDEWRSHEQMKMEGFNAQAAEEARLEREREEEALRENQKELERMRIEREKTNALMEKKKEERRQRGGQVRHQREEMHTAQRAAIVKNLEEQSYGFITMENLDEKIQEAIDYEVDYNFVLSTDGKKITS